MYYVCIYKSILPNLIGSALQDVNLISMHFEDTHFKIFILYVSMIQLNEL